MNTTIFVHPTAQVAATAIIRPGAWIGPNVVIGPGAVIGPYSVIGGPPEHSSFYDDTDGSRTKGVVIGGYCRVFEFVTIQAGTVRPTTLMYHSAVFQHAHVSHDCLVGSYATVAGRSSLAGFVDLQDFANVGAHSIVHQHCVIGALAMIGMGSVLKAHVPPGQTWVGYPARHVGQNLVGIERAGFTQESVETAFDLQFKIATKESRL